ncbi:MAG: hypothetical protein JWR38_4448 [Mucilaginibacter sp.]|nr:hypothetical protein [Mucilaginibacter sp.]
MSDSVKSKLDNEREMENSDQLINMALKQKTIFRNFE